MLGNSPIYANIPVTDLKKSREFYENLKMLGILRILEIIEI